MPLIANLINAAQQWVDQMNTFPVVGWNQGNVKVERVNEEQK